MHPRRRHPRHRPRRRRRALSPRAWIASTSTASFARGDRPRRIPPLARGYGDGAAPATWTATVAAAARTTGMTSNRRDRQVDAGHGRGEDGGGEGSARALRELSESAELGCPRVPGDGAGVRRHLTTRRSYLIGRRTRRVLNTLIIKKIAPRPAPVAPVASSLSRVGSSVFGDRLLLFPLLQRE